MPKKLQDALVKAKATAHQFLDSIHEYKSPYMELAYRKLARSLANYSALPENSRQKFKENIEGMQNGRLGTAHMSTMNIEECEAVVTIVKGWYNEAGYPITDSNLISSPAKEAMRKSLLSQPSILTEFLSKPNPPVKTKLKETTAPAVTSPLALTMASEEKHAFITGGLKSLHHNLTLKKTPPLGEQLLLCTVKEYLFTQGEEYKGSDTEIIAQVLVHQEVIEALTTMYEQQLPHLTQSTTAQAEKARAEHVEQSTASVPAKKEKAFTPPVKPTGTLPSTYRPLSSVREFNKQVVQAEKEGDVASSPPKPASLPSQKVSQEAEKPDPITQERNKWFMVYMKCDLPKLEERYAELKQESSPNLIEKKMVKQLLKQRQYQLEKLRADEAMAEERRQMQMEQQKRAEQRAMIEQISTEFYTIMECILWESNGRITETIDPDKLMDALKRVDTRCIENGTAIFYETAFQYQPLKATKQDKRFLLQELSAKRTSDSDQAVKAAVKLDLFALILIDHLVKLFDLHLQKGEWENDIRFDASIKDTFKIKMTPQGVDLMKELCASLMLAHVRKHPDFPIQDAKFLLNIYRNDASEKNVMLTIWGDSKLLDKLLRKVIKETKSAHFTCLFGSYDRVKKDYDFSLIRDQESSEDPERYEQNEMEDRQLLFFSKAVGKKEKRGKARDFLAIKNPLEMLDIAVSSEFSKGIESRLEQGSSYLNTYIEKNSHSSFGKGGGRY